MGMLYEAWTECSGNWKESKIYSQAKSKDKRTIRGRRRWMTKTELDTKFGEEGARLLVDYKMSDPKLKETETRAHPSAPNVEVWLMSVCAG